PRVGRNGPLDLCQTSVFRRHRRPFPGTECQGRDYPTRAAPRTGVAERRAEAEERTSTPLKVSRSSRSSFECAILRDLNTLSSSAISSNVRKSTWLTVQRGASHEEFNRAEGLAT